MQIRADRDVPEFAHLVTTGTYIVCQLKNAHGDITALTNANGEIVNNYQFDAFGNSLTGMQIGDVSKNVQN